MAKLDSLDVEWHSILLPGHAKDLMRIHIEELGLIVEKPADQPRAGDPVHGGILPGHKSHRLCPHLLSWLSPAPVFLGSPAGHRSSSFPEAILRHDRSAAPARRPPGGHVGICEV